MSDHGPNVTKLLSRFIAVEAIPVGGGIADAILFFTDPEKRKLVLVNAEAKCKTALAAIKAAPDNPYGDDDETIAGVLLEKIKEREANNGRKNQSGN